MLKNIHLIPSTTLFFLLFEEKDSLQKHIHNQEISEKLQYFLETDITSLKETKSSIDSIASYIRKIFPQVLTKKILILIELFQRLHSKFLKTNLALLSQSNKIYPEISKKEYLQFLQTQQSQDLFQVILVDKSDKILWIKEIYIDTETKKIGLKFPEIFAQAILLKTSNLLLIQKTHKKGDIIQIENLKFARKIQEGCDLLELHFVDYLVINPNQEIKSLKKIGIL